MQESKTTPSKTFQEVFIDGIKYVPAEQRPMAEEAKNLLCDVYGVLWLNAYYDPDSEMHRTYSKPLADKMIAANKILGFKQ